jgi:hypothetical protein
VSTTPPPNPFEAFKAAYDQAAESWSKSMEQVLSSEDFAAAAGRMVARYADAQEALRQAAEATSDQLHLPTKDDLARVAELVLNLERKIDAATDQLFELAQSRPELPSPDVWAQISDRLAALETAFQKFVSTPAPIVPATPAPSPGAESTPSAAQKSPSAAEKTPSAAATPDPAPKKQPPRAGSSRTRRTAPKE